jgi:hypothetical protein
MYWLKVEREFYNLHRIAKIDYAMEDGKLLVNIYSDLHSKPLQLREEEAALFLDTIGRADGCWAFSYPDHVSKLISEYLKKVSIPSEEKEELDELIDVPEVE